MSRSVLIVTASQNLLNRTYELLRQDYELFTAGNEPEATAIIRKEHPTLCLLDEAVERISGFQICKMVHSRTDRYHPPCLILTHYPEDYDASRLIVTGADACIDKRRLESDLLEKVRELMEKQPSGPDPSDFPEPEYEAGRDVKPIDLQPSPTKPNQSDDPFILSDEQFRFESGGLESDGDGGATQERASFVAEIHEEYSELEDESENPFPVPADGDYSDPVEPFLNEETQQTGTHMVTPLRDPLLEMASTPPPPSEDSTTPVAFVPKDEKSSSPNQEASLTQAQIERICNEVIDRRLADLAATIRRIVLEELAGNDKTKLDGE
jgi:DNA-binding response OmpR family regulator